MASLAAASGELVTELADSIDSLERLAPEWRELWRSDPAATPFQATDWLIPWTRHLWGGGKLRILVLRRGERLAALAPFFLWGFGDTPEIVRLSFLGSGISDRLDMICAPESAPQAAEAVIRWIRANPEWDLCDLQELRPGSPLLAAAASMEAATRDTCGICPVLPLRPTSAEQLGAVQAGFRRALRTAEKRLRAAGTFEFVRSDAASREDLLDRLFELHTGRWQERGESGMFGTPQLRAFHRDVARGFCRAGMLRLYGLLADGQCIAVQYNFAARQRVYAYLSGFDPAWSRVSPGALLLAHSIGDAIAEGAREFDFLRRRERFKYDWGAIDTPNQRLQIRVWDSPRPSARLAHNLPPTR